MDVLEQNLNYFYTTLVQIGELARKLADKDSYEEQLISALLTKLETDKLVEIINSDSEIITDLRSINQVIEEAHRASTQIIAATRSLIAVIPN
jgi:hypothetical protein